MMTGKIIEWNNRSSHIVPTIFFIVLMILFPAGILYKAHLSVKILVDLFLFFLFYESMCNATTVVQHDEGRLTVFKPGRKYSLFKRKKQKLIILPEEWDNLVFFTISNHGHNMGYYFRKGRTATYYFSFNGLHSLPTELPELFPDKTFTFGRGLPLKVIGELKQHFPDRVI